MWDTFSSVYIKRLMILPKIHDLLQNKCRFFSISLDQGVNINLLYHKGLFVERPAPYLYTLFDKSHLFQHTSPQRLNTGVHKRVLCSGFHEHYPTPPYLFDNTGLVPTANVFHSFLDNSTKKFGLAKKWRLSTHN